MLLLALLAAAPDPGLLDRLQAHTERLAEFERADGALLVGVSAKEFDGDGKVTHDKELSLISTQVAGVTTAKLEKLVEDGVDLTEKKRAEIEEKENAKAHPSKKNGDQARDLLAQRSPFSKQLREKYDFAALPPLESRPELTRVGLKPRGGASEELMVGDALVDAEKGEVVHLSLKPSKLPMLVDRLAIEAEFGQATPAGRSLSRLEFRGEAGLLFLKKRFAAVTTFERR
jgi:hypothetical protein